MSSQCCSTKSLCLDPANPVQNFSSEAPDLTLFIGTNSGWDNSDGGYNTPSIGGTWDSSGCQFTCLSTVSQADADQCAANQQLACADGSWMRPPGHPQQNFLNNQKSCVSLCPDGIPFTFTEPAGVILALNQARANEIAQSFACTNARQRRICLSSLTPSETCLNSGYSGQIVASGGLLSASLNTWTLASGVLPPGLNFAGSITTGPFEAVVTGPVLSIVGTPTQAGTFPFSIRVTAPNGDFQIKTYSLCVIDISPSTLPNGANNTPYNQTLTATCGTAPLNWQVTSGALPTGLSLNQQTGVISGTPTVFGTFNFSVTLQTAAT